MTLKVIYDLYPELFNSEEGCWSVPASLIICKIRELEPKVPPLSMKC